MARHVFFIVASFMLSTAMITSAYEGEDQGLKVETTFKPNNCDEHRKSQSGDELEMHYTGTIDESSPSGTPGKKFDSPRKQSIAIKKYNQASKLSLQIQ